MKRFCMIMLAIAMLVAIGCDGPGSQINPPSSGGEVDSITLLASPPVALNVDGIAGNDVVQMYFFCESAAKPAKATGVLEMLLYESTGSTLPSNLLKTTPHGKWTYSPEQLKTLGSAAMYGIWGYRIGLRWDADNPPKTRRIIVIARYTCPSGRVILSAPANFSMGSE